MELVKVNFLYVHNQTHLVVHSDANQVNVLQTKVNVLQKMVVS